MKKSLIITLVFVLSGVLMHSCKKDPGDPPAIPPAGTMAIDFSNFEEAKKGDVEISVPKGTNKSNWEFSAGIALFWKSVMYTTLAVPVTAFQLAASQDPVYIENRTWEWNYSATVLSESYDAKLTGQIGETNIIWKMYITKGGTGGYENFLWFEGTSEFDGNSGQWILYYSPTSPGAVLQIDWTKTGLEVGTIKCTYVKAGDQYKDSYIEYGQTSNTLNEYYTIHWYNPSVQQFYDLNVEWSKTLHNGRVKCPAYFGTESWYCWDSNFLNVTCS
jgi:hypothetical protein